MGSALRPIGRLLRTGRFAGLLGQNAQTPSVTITLIVAVAVTSFIGCGSKSDRRPASFPAQPQIYSIATDGSDDHSLNVAGIGLARGPDGRIAFLQGGRLAVMNGNGSNVRVLARAYRGPEDPAAPAWSPGGGRLTAGNGSGCDPIDGCER